ncbi:MAG: helix-turn-helix transcriptional regulator [Clostridia bacterium]
MNISRDKIELLQAKQGWTVKELAKKAGISYQTLCTLKGRGGCLPKTAFKLAKALGVDVSEIIEQK